YAREYLKPATQYLNARVNKFNRHGVPALDQWMTRMGVSKQQQSALPGMAQGGVVTDPATIVDDRTGQPVARIAEAGREAVVPQSDALPSWVQTAMAGRAPPPRIPQLDVVKPKSQAAQPPEDAYKDLDPDVFAPYEKARKEREKIRPPAGPT